MTTELGTRDVPSPGSSPTGQAPARVDASRRNKALIVRVTSEQHARVHREAFAEGLTVDKWLRQLINKGYKLHTHRQEASAEPTPQDNAEIVERCARIADKRAAMANVVSHEAARALLIALPDAIRALSSTQGDEK